jgi:hypothetical protein
MTRASEWATRVAAWRASGKTAKEFCKGKDYAAERLLWWSSDLKRRAITTPQGAAVALTRVVLKPDERHRASAVVVCWGGFRVEVAAGADKATVSTVLEALRGPSVGGRR